MIESLAIAPDVTPLKTLEERYQDLLNKYELLNSRYELLEQKYDAVCKALLEYKQQAHYWEAQFNQLKIKYTELEVTVEELKAQLKKREQQLFGRRSEKGTSSTEGSLTEHYLQKKRGHQKGSQGHGRRDFLSHGKAYQDQEKWALNWVDQIGLLYHLNHQRLEHPVESKLFRKHDFALKEQIAITRKILEQQLQDQRLLPAAKKILVSLEKHWEGLTVFVDRPEIPMDNNQAERSLRPSVIGRKNYYGSGAVWSGELAAALFTIFGTLKLWKINPHTWLLSYFQACARAGGKMPENVGTFLPWCMTSDVKLCLSKPPSFDDSG